MFKSSWIFMAVGLAVGIAMGMYAAGMWPQTPVYALSTHGQDNFAMCTGYMDDQVEGVYVLDSLTGDLQCAVASIQNGKFASLFKYNLAKDFPGAAKNPKYLLVSGDANIRAGAGAGNIAPSRSMVYVAELTSGHINSYAVAWNGALATAGQPQGGAIIPVDKWKFRNVAVRGAN